jgi:NADPH-dependent 7-cyano-7-deazaguanine reductase QueF-like protein
VRLSSLNIQNIYILSLNKTKFRMSQEVDAHLDVDMVHTVDAVVVDVITDLDLLDTGLL